MFNTYRGGDTNIKVNAVSGTLVKNYHKSFFVRFQLGSSFGERLLSVAPSILIYSSNKPVVVIQCMCAGGEDGNEMIAEVMWKEDFDAMFETDKN